MDPPSGPAVHQSKLQAMARPSFSRSPTHGRTNAVSDLPQTTSGDRFSFGLVQPTACFQTVCALAGGPGQLVGG